MPVEREKVPREADDPRKRGRWCLGGHGSGWIWQGPEYTGDKEQQKQGGKQNPGIAWVSC